ncbi:MAG TPA: thioredoxin [Candidatus Pullichristensenella excrementipullorum]|nr:thioredoxin [Candidatus Pullichristensenella excrementipullorum]
MRARVIGLGLAVLGVALICAGLSLGQEMGVFQKAIFICMECIGIG